LFAAYDSGPELLLLLPAIMFRSDVLPDAAELEDEDRSRGGF